MTTSPAVDVCIGVVIVTYNSSAHVERLTASLKDALGSISHRVVVVDNASADDTVDAVRGKGIEVIEMGRNAGYSAGINAGLEVLADASAVLILNPDVVLGRSAVAEMNAALSDPAVGVVVPQTREFSGALAYNQRRDPTLLRAVGSAVLGAGRAGRWSTLSETVEDTATYLQTRDIDWGVGAVMMISRVPRRGGSVGRVLLLVFRGDRVLPTCSPTWDAGQVHARCRGLAPGRWRGPATAGCAA